MTVRKEVLSDGVTLYLADCHELRGSLSAVDALISDPPYGQSYKVNTFATGDQRAAAPVLQPTGKTMMVRAKVHRPVVGDDEPFDPSPWIGIAPRIVLWGAHKFADRLPPGMWLVWDKVPNGKVRRQGDGEAAWMNDTKPMRIYRLLWDGICVGSAARHEVTNGQQRVHPTQKPVALMDWTIAQADLAPDSLILDPYMGAGSTGIAAVKAGHRFMGIEIDEEHFDTACRRISDALRAPADMFATA